MKRKIILLFAIAVVTVNLSSCIVREPRHHEYGHEHHEHGEHHEDHDRR